MALWRRKPKSESEADRPVEVRTVEPVDIAPDDPLLAYLQDVARPVEVDKLAVDSAALEEMKASGVELIVPLVTQGELVGILNLGPRLSERDYSTDDRKLLDSLASQAAPAVRVAQLVREQELEAQQRERIAQELRVARLIQQTLLPKELPQISGWTVKAYYRPAREVGGDFYDFIDLGDGRLGVVEGDVTDKGVPAAIVMATCRTMLRAAARRFDDPGRVLEAVNENLHVDIPPNMFVTCFYAVIDTSTGLIRYANAGHNLPYVRTDTGVDELRATGMPLGLMPGMSYEVKEAKISHGDAILIHSDGVVEAHSPSGEMFGFGSLMGIMGAYGHAENLVDRVMGELADFTGSDWEQEDDVTLVVLRRTSTAQEAAATLMAENVLAEFEIESREGNEREVIDRIEQVVAPVGLSEVRLQRLKTAVGEATMNAIEHGNRNDPALPVGVMVKTDSRAVRVHVVDRGSGSGDHSLDPDTPDLEAKLAGEQSPRGWGLFLIENMVDEVNETTDDGLHQVELVMYLEGDGHDRA
ncbi:MAG TPA: SpoIIE family protein phosphatase [Acidimicrobiia bacterium]|nr:SpoIIE family protein phosphatase [Acidimicrobiia bacterium]